MIQPFHKLPAVSITDPESSSHSSSPPGRLRISGQSCRKKIPCLEETGILLFLYPHLAECLPDGLCRGIFNAYIIFCTSFLFRYKSMKGIWKQSRQPRTNSFSRTVRVCQNDNAPFFIRRADISNNGRTQRIALRYNDISFHCTGDARRIRFSFRNDNLPNHQSLTT